MKVVRIVICLTVQKYLSYFLLFAPSSYASGFRPWFKSIFEIFCKMQISGPFSPDSLTWQVWGGAPKHLF